MRFEHLVIVNDPQFPLAEWVSRDEVWAGLLMRVEDARLFLPGLEVCEVLTRNGPVLERRLSFGTTDIFDRVTLVERESVCFDTAPSEHHGGGRLLIRIEETCEGHLMLRFIYATQFATGHETEDAPYSDYLRQAYEAADIDTVSVIRELTAARRRPL